MNIDNIPRAKELLKRLSDAQRNLIELQCITNDWRSIKIVVIDNKSYEVNISRSVAHAEALILRMITMMTDEISDIEKELKTL